MISWQNSTKLIKNKYQLYTFLPETEKTLFDLFYEANIDPDIKTKQR